MDQRIGTYWDYKFAMSFRHRRTQPKHCRDSQASRWLARNLTTANLLDRLGTCERRRQTDQTRRRLFHPLHLEGWCMKRHDVFGGTLADVLFGAMLRGKQVRLEGCQGEDP